MAASRLQVEFIPWLSNAQNISAAAASANVQINNPEIRGVTLTPVEGVFVNISESVGAVATTSSHYLIKGVPQSFRIADKFYIHALAESTPGTLYISELT